MSEDRVEVLQVSEFPPWTTEKLEAEFTVHKYHSAAQPAALLSRVAGGVRAVVATAPDPVDSAMIHAIPGLEIVSCFAVGVDFVDLAAAAERGVVVTNTPEVLTDCVADLA
ncbi:MAG: 2-hydroxyacid dehydrogenase, partial [Alphaproteobacteria bacterium]